MVADTVAQLEAQSERISEAAQERRASSERTNVRIREMTAELALIDGEYRAEQAAATRSAEQAEEYKKFGNDGSHNRGGKGPTQKPLPPALLMQRGGFR